MSAPKGKNETSSSTGSFNFKLSDVPKYFRAYMYDVLDLQKGVNEHATIIEIRKKSSMAGANAWMLMCSIVIASIGLSQNSQAVIIGAMLISPLMSPILGIGLSIGINDMETLRNSLTHFGIAIIIALITSTIYFEFTPFDAITHEIESRTRPTFLDVLVAIFGGVAGIVSVVRKDLSTTLPGVAIATALMPPLCVAGYGISHGLWDMASKAFYLFFLNSFFVALSTYVIIRLLGFPYKTYLNARKRRLNMISILLFSLALIIPSFLIFRSVLRDARFENSIKKFSTTCLGDNSKYLDSYNHKTFEDGSKVLYLKVYGDLINYENIDQYKSCLADLGVKNCEIQILNSSEVNIDDVEILNSSIVEIQNRLDAAKEERGNNKKIIEFYNSNQIDTLVFAQISKELKGLFPELKSLSAARMHIYDFSSQNYYLSTIILEWENSKSGQESDSVQKIESFMKQRLSLDSIRIISLP